ncbi:Nucleoporin-like protein 2 [Trichoplax sp. H2]|nr:Nucleoporin-like protein 2 [Trichoplax sp. H2]|eukprot:RDD44732.1 Nucleoporin-like protein 2 [Trichoplax sp. H2]
MTVCKYYMRGFCRFGNNCKFEHPGGYSKGTQQKPNENYTYNRNYDHSRDNQRNAAAGNSLFTRQNVLQTIRKDIDEQNQSLVWPLSCYAFVGTKACLAEFPEYSMEEIRWEAYVANASNNFGQYQTVLMHLMNQVKEKRQYLHNIPKNDQDGVVKLAGSSKFNESDSNSRFDNNNQRSLGGFPTTGVKNLLQNPFEKKSENPFNQTTPNLGGFGQQQQQSMFSSNISQNNPFNPVNTLQQTPVNNIQPSMSSNNTQQGMGSFLQQDRSFFNQKPESTMSPTQQPSNFTHSPQSLQPTVGNNQTSIQSSFELTEEDTKQYLANSFTLYSVPEVPPLPKYC